MEKTCPELFPRRRVWPPKTAGERRVVNEAQPGSPLVRRLAGAPPFRAVIDNPVREGALKADVVTGFLRFDPLVLQDLFTLRLKFPVQGRIPDQISTALDWRIFGTHHTQAGQKLTCSWLADNPKSISRPR